MFRICDMMRGNLGRSVLVIIIIMIMVMMIINIIINIVIIIIQIITITDIQHFHSFY
jgi:hypothetical protein